MCRHLAYLGPAVPVAELILHRPHSLLRQTWAPRDMRQGGTINADGFGVGWYLPGSEVPVRYRRTVPMWADENLPGLTSSVRSGAVLAAARNGTTGMPVMETAAAPFTSGPWLFSHNGAITGWPASMTELAARLPVSDLLTLDAPTDAALLWALLRHRLADDGDPAGTLAGLVTEVAASAPGSRLNLLLTDGQVVAATTWGHSLSVITTPDAVVISSEPWDEDPGWQEVPDRHLVVARLIDGRPDVNLTPLEKNPAKNPEKNRTDMTHQVDVHLTDDHAARSLRSDAVVGLSAAEKWLPPKWFYDARGSELFELITELPEYYPTRAEREILTTRAAEIAEVTGAHTLVELGSGSSEKTRLLLSALRDHGTLTQFVPLDVSESALREAAQAIAADYPELTVHGVVGDFTEHLDLLPGEPPRLVAFLGGTIGNLLPAERAKFLAGLRGVLNAGEWLLLGTDLVKDPGVLVPAYDDAAGVTAEFNRNVLQVLNRELGADFDVTAFRHIAVWDADHEWIEMRLRAERPMHVRLADVGLEIDFTEGEEMRTEISAKFRREGISAELADAGFDLTDWWTDEAGRFALSLSRATE
jgi:dimethylhistidine N-methyltransferase/ergothioneine biosynthesis protein EgtC